jgi:hypothetical protein
MRGLGLLSLEQELSHAQRSGKQLFGRFHVSRCASACNGDEASRR